MVSYGRQEYPSQNLSAHSDFKASTDVKSEYYYVRGGPDKHAIVRREPSRISSPSESPARALDHAPYNLSTRSNGFVRGNGFRDSSSRHPDITSRPGALEYAGVVFVQPPNGNTIPPQFPSHPYPPLHDSFPSEAAEHGYNSATGTMYTNGAFQPGYPARYIAPTNGALPYYEPDGPPYHSFSGVTAVQYSSIYNQPSPSASVPQPYILPPSNPNNGIAGTRAPLVPPVSAIVGPKENSCCCVIC
ncbi:hypothetical protein NEOLEDRAFT_1147789 [Neolentinus lepideus HHB14362 ss-1]|uniref:Uncharacterized protein n=1 Tax=Neolentinus lepideus HHB14362 ss-1 TaxID=1314782 RepID=A0A165SVM9_9AGAM|nr:hypothetical protein NEOLEDRAFT_1147789 [Neolentinus lepideus HHB14362 ss-1]